MIPENVQDEETTEPATITIVRTEGKEAKVWFGERDLKAKALSVGAELNRKFARSSIQSLDRYHSASPLKRLTTLPVVLQVEDALIQQGRNI